MNKRFFFACKVLLCLLLIHSCSKDDSITDDGSKNTTDVAVTGNVAKVGISYAQLEGYVNLNLVTVTYSKQELGIELSMSEDFEDLDNIKTNELTGNKISVKVDKLDADTKYYYRTYVKLNDIIFYGKTRSFSTKDFKNITSTGEATDITYSSALISCTVDMKSIDSEENYSIGVAYSDTRPDDNNWKNHMIAHNAEDGKYSVTLNNLKEDQTYYYCSFTYMAGKYKTGQVKSFTTKVNNMKKYNYSWLLLNTTLGATASTAERTAALLAEEEVNSLIAAALAKEGFQVNQTGQTFSILTENEPIIIDKKIMVAIYAVFADEALKNAVKPLPSSSRLVIKRGSTIVLEYSLK